MRSGAACLRWRQALAPIERRRRKARWAETVLRDKLDELRECGDQVSEKALHQAENTWNEFSDVLQRLTSRTTDRAPRASFGGAPPLVAMNMAIGRGER